MSNPEANQSVQLATICTNAAILQISVPFLNGRIRPETLDACSALQQSKRFRDQALTDIADEKFVEKLAVASLLLDKLEKEVLSGVFRESTENELKLYISEMK